MMVSPGPLVLGRRRETAKRKIEMRRPSKSGSGVENGSHFPRVCACLFSWQNKLGGKVVTA